MNRDELNDIEIQILKDFYERDFNRQTDMKINASKYDLVELDSRLRVQEFTSILNRLKRLHYLKIAYNAFNSGGRPSEKYQNNTLMIWEDRIELTHRGRLFIEELKNPQTVEANDITVEVDSGFWYNVKRSLKWLGARIVDEAVSIVISSCLGTAFGFLLAQWFN